MAIFGAYYVKYFGERQPDGKVWTDEAVAKDLNDGTTVQQISNWRMFAQQYYQDMLNDGKFPTDVEVIDEWLRFHPEDKPHTHKPTPYGQVDIPLPATSVDAAISQIELAVGQLRVLLASR